MFHVLSCGMVLVHPFDGQLEEVAGGVWGLQHKDSAQQNILISFIAPSPRLYHHT